MFKKIRNNLKLIVKLSVILVCIVYLAGCTTTYNQTGLLLSRIDLPEEYNTTDGMVLGEDNNIYLSCLNCNNTKYPPKLLKISPDDKITEVYTFEPETGLLGIDIGKDGNFYIADNKTFFGKTEHASRLLRLIMKDGKAVKCEVLVTGFIMSNAVSCHGDSVYVTETNLKNGVSPMPSGVYRFNYSEFNGDKPVVLEPDGKDKHLTTTFTTENDDWRGGVGANGMGFDSNGNLLVCNFGEASILRMELDKKGDVISKEIFAEGQGMESTDGMKVDPETDDVYVADFAGNAVHMIDAKTQKVITIFKNANNTDGVAGLLDKPSEVCMRGNKIYVSNIDLDLDGNKYDDIHNISILTIEK